MKTGPRLVIQGAILGSILLGSLSYFVNAGAAPLDKQQPISRNSQEVIPSPTVPVNQDSVPLAQPTTQDAGLQAAPALAATITETSAPVQPTATRPAPGKPKQQKPACQVNASYPDNILQWCDLIMKYANQYDLDANLIAAVMLQESGGNSQAYSSSGAVGLMQVMPNDGVAAGFTCPGGPCFAKRPSTQELLDPEFNIKYGTRMLASLMDKYGDVREALKVYGPGNVGYYYVNKVMAIYENYN